MGLCKKILKIALLASVTLVLISGPIFAAYSYYVTIQVQETDGISYDYLPIIADIDNDFLANNGYMSLTGLDTRILSGSTPLKHMVADDKVLFVPPSTDGNSTGNYKYTLGNSLLSDFPIIVGDGGYITVADDATLELADDFEIEISGYVDTDADSNKNLVYKKDAFWIRVSEFDNDTIESVIYDYTDPIDVTPGVGVWTDVNVSAYVPDEATGVIVHLYAPVSQIVNVRKNGSTDNRLNDLVRHNWTMVGIDNNDIFEAFVTGANDKVYLVGWTGSDYTFKTNATDISLGAGFADWTEIDLTAQTSADTVGVIIEVENTNIAAREYGFRKEGSTDNRHVDLFQGGVAWAVIGCDSSQVIEHWAEDTDINAYLVGYIEGDDTIFKTDGDDISLVPVGSWENIDCSTEAPKADFIIVEAIGAGGTYGLREDGSAEDVYNNIDDHRWGIVKCTDAQIIEGKISAIAIDFFIVGYIRDGCGLPGVLKVEATGISSGEYIVKVVIELR